MASGLAMSSLMHLVDTHTHITLVFKGTASEVDPVHSTPLHINLVVVFF
jgi:hypothetical protein